MSGKTPSEVHAKTDHACTESLVTALLTHLSLTDNAQIKAMVEQAKAIALAKAQMLQQQHQAATSPAAPPSMDDIARRKAALAARMAALTASKGTPGLPAAATPAPVDARTRAAQMGSMVSTDAAGNLIINSVASGKKVQAPSFATVKVNRILYCKFPVCIDSREEETKLMLFPKLLLMCNLD